MNDNEALPHKTRHGRLHNVWSLIFSGTCSVAIGEVWVRNCMSSREREYFSWHAFAYLVDLLQMEASGMIDMADFATINKDMTEYDEKREKVIKDSRGTPQIHHHAHSDVITARALDMRAVCAAQTYRSSLSRPSTACIVETWMVQQRSWPRRRKAQGSSGPSWMQRARCARVVPSPPP